MRNFCFLFLFIQNKQLCDMPVLHSPPIFVQKNKIFTYYVTDESI